MTEVVHHSLHNKTLQAQYRDAGFAGRVGWGERPAILVIDMAYAWTRSSEQLGSDLDGVLGGIVRLLAVGRSHDVPIFFTTMSYDVKTTEISDVLRLKTPHCLEMARGSRRVELVPELGRRPNEPVIAKPHASGFFGTNLLSLLIGQRVDTVVVVGCSTSGCIRSTCESGFNYSFHVIVPKQAVGDRSASAHEAALFDIDARFGDVVQLDDVLAHLERSPTSVARTA